MAFSPTDLLSPLAGVASIYEGDYTPKWAQAKTKARKTKKVTLQTGEVIDIPEGFDTTLFEQEKALRGDVMSGIEGQVKTAEGVEGAVRGAGEASLMSAKQRAAGQLASFRGMGEGGRGAALGRGAAAAANITEAGIRGETELAAQEARTGLSQARTEAALAKKAVIDAQKQEATAVASATADAQAVIEANTGNVYTDSDDIKQMKLQLTAKRDAATDPRVKMAYQRVLDQIANKSLDTGAVDTWK